MFSFETIFSIWNLKYKHNLGRGLYEVKKLIVLLLLFSLLVLPGIAFGGQDNEITNDIGIMSFQYLSKAESLMFVNSNKTISVSGETGSYVNVEKLSVTVYLQKYSNGSWSNVKSWDFSKSSSSSIIGTATSSTLSSGTYRVKSYHRIDHGGLIETTYSYTGSTVI